MSLQTRTNATNAENNGPSKSKGIATSFGLKRAALGEIGNKVVARSNSVSSDKPDIKPSQGTKTLERSQSLQKGVSSISQKPVVFVKPRPKPVAVNNKLKRSASTTSTTSIVLPPPRQEARIRAAESGFSNNLERHEFNVDAEDLDNPFLVADYAFEIYEYLRQLEEKFPIKDNFLAGQEVTPRMRSTLVDWLVDVQQQYHLLQETLYLTIQFIDRYLQAIPTTKRQYLQLVGVTAMLVACKYEEIHSPDISDFVYITDSAYSKHEVLAMEVQLVKALKFEFNRPISLTFLRRYSKVVEAMPVHHCFSKFFLELALMEYGFSHINPSLVAAASLYISLCIHPHKGKQGPLHWDAKMVHYSTYKLKDVEPVAQKLAAVILKAPSSKFEAVRKKYSSSKMMMVSLREELDEECLKRLAEGLQPFPNV